MQRQPGLYQARDRDHRAGAAAGGLGALLYTFLADDMVQTPGYGKRTILSPEGAIKLNDNDTIIADEEHLWTVNSQNWNKERTITTPGIKPGTKPGTPYRPKPGPKKNPKAEKGDMPDWLSFDELGIDFE